MTATKPDKPLGQKSYGSIPHLIGSKRGSGDKGVNEGQHRICTAKCRKGDRIIVTEKLDGTNVSVAKIDGAIVPLVRAGYRAGSSRHRQHHMFAAWVFERQGMFADILDDGERLCGEWLSQAHGIRYDLEGREPFVAFDLMRGTERAGIEEFESRIGISGVREPYVRIAPVLVVSVGAVSIERAMDVLGENGHYGAQGPAEGVVYRVENNGKVDFLAKYVRPDHPTGQYLPGLECSIVDEPVWNWRPTAPIDNRPAITEN